MLAEAQKAGQILDEEQLVFLADPSISEAPTTYQTIPQNSSFQTDNLDAYDSDYSVKNVKKDIDEIETINIELEHNVAKLLSENKNLRKEREHLKSIFKDQFDSIGKTRVQSKEHCDSLIAQINAKSVENSDLNAQLQEKTCPNSQKPSEKLVDVTLKNKDKRVRFVKPVTSSSNIPKQTDSLKTKDSNKPLLTSIGVKPTTSASGLKPSATTKNNRITRPPRNRSQLMNFVSKFMGTVRFVNDQVEKIMGYDDYQQGNVIILRVYYVEGLRNNLFSVGQFCDTGLEVAFRKNTCFIRNLEASKTKSWLWHRLLSHLNFGILYKLAKDGLTRGIPKLKFQKDHLCSACAFGKSKKFSHQPKAEDTNKEKLYLLHMDLCGPMRVESINGKQHILTLRDFYENVGISHQTFVALTPQQNGIVERRNRTLVEAARTMLIFSKAHLFLWAEAINTACYTQNRSLIRLRYNKTPYELMHDKKPDLSFLHVFGSLCYPTNDSKDLGKLNANADIGIFVGYAPTKKAFRIYNRRTRKIMETIHVTTRTNIIPQQPCNPPHRDDCDHLFQPLFDEYFNPPSSIVSPVLVTAAPRAVDIADSVGY
ncbi:retrovirus-related pol polyprotein from transposon TNT 1-94 [Tanacetum coccineum]